ncbi:MAG: transcription-repair coupling factor [Nitrospira sp.]|nr:transcription-repair coupling factor [Candidatus Manganitrophaceae bacterium]HIL34352.1 transcription-repair coupling factor [Candidatus Manganitrophaceae bacterium]
MTIHQLKASYFSPVMEAIEGGASKIKVNGLWGSSEAFFLASLIREGKSFCLVAPSYAQAEQIFQEIRFFVEIDPLPPPLSFELLFFPPWDILPYEPAAPRPDWIAQRLATLHCLASGPAACVVTSIEAFLQKVVSRAFLSEHHEVIRVGDSLSMESLIEGLGKVGYEVSGGVTQYGELAVRGGIIDLFPPTATHPIRIEFFGDQIESIRAFDPESQKSIKPIDMVEVIPGREDILDPRYYQTPFSAYLSSEAILVFDEPDEVVQKGKRFLEEAEDGALFARKRNAKHPKVEDLYLPLTHLADAGSGGMTIDLESLSLRQERGVERFTFDTHSVSSLGLDRPGQPFSEMIKILDALRRDHMVMVSVRNEGQLTRFQHLFSDHEIPWALWKGEKGIAISFPAPIFLAVGPISEGFSLPQVKAIFLIEKSLFGSGRVSRPRPQKSHARAAGEKDNRESFLSSFKDLKPSDYVVHVHHGIGRFVGLKRLAIRQEERGPQQESDFLVLEYAKGDKVYVPLDSFELVQRYVGLEGKPPRLDRLGGGSWSKTKARVRSEIREMTQELLNLYAQREVVEGHAFSTPESMAEEFAASFEYEETPDQLRSIQEVIRDMEKPKPMDRLVCGDVGYGKTEVAMRAAFHAVMDNKQTAIVVPTTLLAQQHFQTFVKRFAPFPIRVEVISRFRSRREQKEIIAALGEGRVDILIGTHRLLQGDIRFRDLGLLVIDEEHRFGVRHKERMKQIRKQVDVLTLTATPIPRTLQMALAKVRDLSVIETAPADRLAVRTILSPFDAGIIREAIFRELVRGGQVFFVHNRVNSIDQIGTFLAELIPEARIGIAHGQMSVQALEEVMIKFLSKEYNLLVTTTIIESGIDVPSANTIIINDAERFGLAELYQLRGRVGRSGEQAYAYLLVREGRILTEESRQRLQAIQEFTELGSGFRIAARDLEIRGAGNLLGQEQSGQIAAIGFELYLRMIDEMVQELKGTPTEKEIEPSLQFSISAFIPDDYISDSYQRLVIYKRLSSCQGLSEVEAIRAELEDRYGHIPDPLNHLLQIIQLKKLALPICITQIEEQDKTILFVFDESTPLTEGDLQRVLKQFKGKIHFTSPYSFELKPRSKAWEDLFLETAHCLKVLQKRGG